MTSQKPDQIQEVQKPQLPPVQRESPNGMSEYLSVLSALRRPRQHINYVPNNIPKTFLDQIQFYDDGTNRRVYLYINGAWRYVALT